jgi:hypothetical protein
MFKRFANQKGNHKKLFSFYHTFRITLIKAVIGVFSTNDEFARLYYKARLHHLSSRICFEQDSVDLEDSYRTYTIADGPFLGMKLLANSSQQLDPIPVLKQKQAGVYEQEVLYCLSEGNYSTIIDIGAGSGYYSLGMLFSNKCQKAIMFEKNEKNHPLILECARLNGINESKVSLFGSIDKNSLTSILRNQTDTANSKTIILCDIEGQEFDLFDSLLIQHLADSKVTLLVEIHKNRKSKIFDLFRSLELYFDIHPLPTMRRDLTGCFVEFPLITDRWLFASENRGEGCQVLAIPKQLLT